MRLCGGARTHKACEGTSVQEVRSNLAAAAASDGLAVTAGKGTQLRAAGAWIVSPKAVVLGMLLFALVWLWHLDFTSLSPPVDVLEQLTWVRSLEWGYYKHPPLPTWLLWLPVKVFGWAAWTVYATGAATTLAALAIYWRLMARLRGESHALVALLAAACITYYNGRLYYYNHNVVLLLASTACAALTWQAFEARQLRWWLALGLAIGLGALAKYQIVVTACSVLAFALHQRAWRDGFHRRGLLLASLVALVTFTPHIAWLHTHDFGPVGYVLHSSLAAHFGAVTRVVEAAHWLVDQIFNRALPALLLLLWVAASARRRPRVVNVPGPMPLDEPARARALLFAWGVVPLIFMPLVGVVAGADLQLHWGSPFLLFAVPATMELLAPRVAWQRVEARTLVGAFLSIQLLLLTISHLTSPRGPRGLHDGPWRNTDSQGIAAALAAPARAALGGPIRVIAGPASLAGAIALELAEHPLVLIDGRFDRSPWVAANLVLDCGAIELAPSARMPSGTAFGSVLPGWSWRALPAAAAAVCPSLSRQTVSR